MSEVFRKGLLDGTTVVVTGGGSGLGRATALRVAELGARVAVFGRREQALRETVEAVEGAAGHAAAAVCDIRDSKAVARAFDLAEEALGPVDRLVNNAAGNFLCPSEDLSDNAFDSVVRIVLHGAFYCTRELGTRLIARGRPGAVVSIVTTYANSGSGFVLPSAVAKAGVAAMTRSLAVEWAAYGIRLNAVAPGLFPTEGAFSKLVPHPEVEREALARIPARRFGEHRELTNLIAYLLSEISPFQTGDVVTIDGGESLLSGQQFSGFTRLDRAQAKAMMAALRPRS